MDERARSPKIPSLANILGAEKETFFSVILDIFHDAVIAIDEVQKITFFNQGARRIFGYSDADVLGKPLDILLPRDRIAVHREHVRRFADSQKSTARMDERSEIHGRRKDGSIFPAEASIAKAAGNGKTIFVVILRDITKQKEVLHKLEELSTTDALTGIDNRRAMEHELKREIDRARRTTRSFCLVLGDIDHFKRVNDVYGHDGGDFALREVAQLVKRMLRTNDSVARWGGEEFCILLPETTAVQAHTPIERIRGKLEESRFSWAGRDIAVTMTFGVAYHDLHGSLEQTLKRADHALYRGKDGGRNRIVIDGQK